MSRTTAKLYLYFGLIFSIICAISIVIFHKEYTVIAPVSFLTCVSIPLTLAGYFGMKKDYSDEENEKIKKERDAAMILSFIPGLGHKYMGASKKGIPHFIIFILSIILMALFAMMIIGIIEKTPEEATVYLLYGLILLLFAWMWSAIDVNDLCNKSDLPYENGFFEMKLSNSDIGILVTSIVFYIIGLITSWFMLNEKWIDYTVFLMVTIISLLAPLYSIYRYSFHKKESRSICD